MAVYVGLDSSTQSLTAVVIEVTERHRRVLLERSLRFDEDLGHHGTRNGVLPNENPLVSHSSPRLWGETLDWMLGKLSKEGDFPLSELRAISGSGQQHGSVYLNGKASGVLSRLSGDRPLLEQLDGIFSRSTSPIWMDSSTRKECDEIADAVGGDEILAKITGSRAFERFTGPQIRSFFKEEPENYEETRNIHLVSSYMATLLAGKHAALDPGDASGMNLMDLATKRWAGTAVEATAPGLLERLPAIKEAWYINSTLSSYWVERYGYPEGVKVVSWSGDNPCSLVGVGLVEPGRVAISLGTSDTLFGFMPELRVDPAGEGHAFGSPTGNYMSLICFKNGSLAREHIRNQYGLDWAGFSGALEKTLPGNGGGIMLPWFESEITPKVLEPGVRRYCLDPRDGPANVRAVVEAQQLSMAVHSQWMDVETVTVYATGGAASNREILQVMANVQDADVYQFRVSNSAALGAALRAYHADEVSCGNGIGWRDVIRGFAEPVLESRIQPESPHVSMYVEMKKVFAACEAHALRGEIDPLPLIRSFQRRYSSR